MAQDDSVQNGASIIYLLKLYALREHFVNIEKLAPKALNWEKYSIDAQLLLLESASKFGSKTLVKERAQNLFFDFDGLDDDQFTTLLQYLNSAGLKDLVDLACERYEKKSGCILVSNRVKNLLKQNEVDEALELLKKNPIDVVGHQYLLGNTLQKKGDYADAFNAWEKGGKLQINGDPTIKKHMNNSNRLFKEYRSIIPTLEKNLDIFKGDEGKNHVFIVGFPRSGTTLLDNILDTQDDLLVLSERQILQATVKEFKNFGKKYPKDISNLSSDELDRMRHRYIEVIKEEQGFKIPKSGIIIEKNPHYTHKIPLIKTLFPKSKLIISIRHPLDVCLSCLQQYFTMNAYNAHLLIFKDIVDHYIAVFELLEQYEIKLGIEFLYVRYEDLVDDLEAEMDKVFSYIGFVANNSYLDFHKHADKKFVTSASRGQTNQPLYKTSKYKWKNYEEQLAPYAEKLSYFIEKFGYA